MSDIDLNKIGNILKTRRLEKNLSIRDLSARSDTAASTISQIETGKTSGGIPHHPGKKRNVGSNH